MIKTLPIAPIGKPRMTQRDKWKKRPCVMRYRAFCDELRLRMGKLPEDPDTLFVRAFFAMPKSWSKVKKEAMDGQRHRQKPDSDNIGKAVMDALFKDDSGISDVTVLKRWSTYPSLTVIVSSGQEGRAG